MEKLEVGKLVKITNGSPTECKLFWEIVTIVSMDVIHIKTSTMFGSFFKVVDLDDIVLLG